MKTKECIKKNPDLIRYQYLPINGLIAQVETARKRVSGLSYDIALLEKMETTLLHTLYKVNFTDREERREAELHLESVSCRLSTLRDALDCAEVYHISLKTILSNRLA